MTVPKYGGAGLLQIRGRAWCQAFGRVQSRHEQ